MNANQSLAELMASEVDARKEVKLHMRFWSKVDTSGGPDACWPWTASTTLDGYGSFGIEGKSYRSNRLVASRLAGKILSPGDVCMHACDNRLCCNPDHIKIGTTKDNMMDMVLKGRHHHQKKTHCPSGHEYSTENTRVYGTHRICKVCQNVNRTKHKQKERLCKSEDLARKFLSKCRESMTGIAGVSQEPLKDTGYLPGF